MNSGWVLEIEIVDDVCHDIWRNLEIVLVVPELLGFYKFLDYWSRPAWIRWKNREIENRYGTRDPSTLILLEPSGAVLASGGNDEKEGTNDSASSMEEEA